MLKPIWLDENLYPNYQKTFCTVFADKVGYNFCVAEFMRTYSFEKRVQKMRISVSADTKFQLWCCGEWVGQGPVAAGGDFANQLPMPKHYGNEYEITTDLSDIDFFARVYMPPDVMTDCSCGHGMFILRCEIIFEDGTTEIIRTDKDWSARLNLSFKDTRHLDNTISADDWHPAVETTMIWNLCQAPIPMLAESLLTPQDGITSITVPANQTIVHTAVFDMIYAGFICFKIECEGYTEIIADIAEKPGEYYSKTSVITDKSLDFRGLRLESLGEYRLTITNKSDKHAIITDIGLVSTHYPIAQEGEFNCSDELLNRIYNLGKHTLKICRQTLHLDSPLHQETLGCTGDYAIESLINYFVFGDARLTRFDIIRTADSLRMNGGSMFHTSYSLIWVEMMYDYYMFTGDKSIFADTEQALQILFELFDSYTVDNIIENPPNYMFIDWVMIDEFTMHHPPKAMGQTALNAFYYKALTVAVDICRIMGDSFHENLYMQRAAAVKKAFSVFYDNERGLYFSGKNDDYEEAKHLPKNTNKRYHLCHSNILAVLYGLCDNPVEVMEKVMAEKTPFTLQPYFMHYLFEALTISGLFSKYGMTEIRRWKGIVDECEKGMKEIWDSGNFSCDYSHAWGATPTYQLPSKLLGFTMKEAGFKSISLAPNLFDLDSAYIKMPTPYGYIECTLKKGEKPHISIPNGIKYEIHDFTEN